MPPAHRRRQSPPSLPSSPPGLAPGVQKSPPRARNARLDGAGSSPAMTRRDEAILRIRRRGPSEGNLGLRRDSEIRDNATPPSPSLSRRRPGPILRYRPPTKGDEDPPSLPSSPPGLTRESRKAHPARGTLGWMAGSSPAMTMESEKTTISFPQNKRRATRTRLLSSCVNRPQCAPTGAPSGPLPSGLRMRNAPTTASSEIDAPTVNAVRSPPVNASSSVTPGPAIAAVVMVMIAT